MTKDPSYFESKMRLLQRITGLEFLEEEFSSKAGNTPRNDIFIGYKVFDSKTTVQNRFTQGNALSCFCIDSKRDRVHVAFKVAKQDYNLITYVTIFMRYELKEEAGVHFREFEIQGTGEIERGSTRITDFAIMLPYWNKNRFIRQYTLIYSDWDVLRNDGLQGRPTKGPTPVSKMLFAEIMNNV